MTQLRPLKVLQITDTLGMGGAETWLMELLQYWARTGAVQVDVLATSGRRGLFDDQVSALGARIHYLRYARANLLDFVQRFRRILQHGYYDAVHDHSDYASGWRYLMALGDLPLVRLTHVHNPLLHLQNGYLEGPTRRMVAKAGRRLVLRLATHVCGTSGQVLSDYGFIVGCRRPAISVVHCGFNVEKFNAPRAADRRSVVEEFAFPSDVKIALFAGRLDRDLEVNHPRNHKNSWLAVLIGCAAMKIDPTVRLLMAGAGEAQRAAIESRIAGSGLADRVRLIGVRSDVDRLMRAADALLFPSTEEGLGMVAVEAQAAGLPVVMSDTVPPEAIVVPDLLRSVSLAESAESWANILLRAMVAKRPSLQACRAALMSSPFSITHSASRLETIYRSAQQ